MSLQFCPCGVLSLKVWVIHFYCYLRRRGIRALHLHQVDAVVLDYLMPGMDGEETARRIRKLRADIPIILSSGCLMVPERVFQVVTIAVEKAGRTEALIEILEQHLHPLVESTLNGIVTLVPIRY